MQLETADFAPSAANGELDHLAGAATWRTGHDVYICFWPTYSII